VSAMELVYSSVAVAETRRQFGNREVRGISAVGSLVVAAKQRVLKTCIWTLECV
jgi:hypothetical protein